MKKSVKLVLSNLSDLYIIFSFTTIYPRFYLGFKKQVPRKKNENHRTIQYCQKFFWFDNSIYYFIDFIDLEGLVMFCDWNFYNLQLERIPKMHPCLIYNALREKNASVKVPADWQWKNLAIIFITNKFVINAIQYQNL